MIMTVDTTTDTYTDSTHNQLLISKIGGVMLGEEEVKDEKVTCNCQPDNNFLPFGGLSPKGCIFSGYFLFMCFDSSSGSHFSVLLNPKGNTDEQLKEGGKKKTSCVAQW